MAAVIPPAPGWFWTMTCWPSSPVSFSATIRRLVSAIPPGPNGTTTATGCVG